MQQQDLPKMWLGYPKMIYTKDFQLQCYKNRELKQSAFTVMLGSKNRSRGKFSKRSVQVAGRPLMDFGSLFGIRTVGCRNQSYKVKLFNRLYTSMLIFIIIMLFAFVKPANWDDTVRDTPLKILSKAQGIQEILEIVFFIFVTSFKNNHEYKKLYALFNDIDEHLNVSKKMYMLRRSVAIILIIIPIVELTLTFWLRKFSLQNIVSHLIFFLLELQGAICAFFLINMYCNILIFKTLLIKKSEYTPTSKQIALGSSMFNILLQKCQNTAAKRYKNVCWFELMQMYDKIADTVYIFNRIYNEQVLIIFSSWFMTTLLVICRILSPSVENSNIIVSEFLQYLLINTRPIFLTKMSACFVSERKTIISVILNIKLYMNEDYRYTEQVQRMLDLAQTRKVEISTNVFSVNILVVINFAGRVISNAVLMIQYFYLYVHEIGLKQ